MLSPKHTHLLIPSSCRDALALGIGLGDGWGRGAGRRDAALLGARWRAEGPVPQGNQDEPHPVGSVPTAPGLWLSDWLFSTAARGSERTFRVEPRSCPVLGGEVKDKGGQSGTGVLA